MRKLIFSFFFIPLCFVLFLSNVVSSELTQARAISLSSKDAMSAWTQPKGQFYNLLIYSYHESDHKFTTIETDEDGTILDVNSDVMRIETPSFTANSITYYGEFGITDLLTIFTSIPWIDTRYEESIMYSGIDGPDGIGDINIGLRYNLTKNLFDSDVLMSIQSEVKIPEAYDYSFPLTHLNLGDGQYDTTITFLFGKAFSKGYGWANIGYKIRFKNDEYDPLTFDPSDQINVSLGGGFYVTSKMSIRGIVDWTKSVRNASVSDELVRESYMYGGIFMFGDTLLIKDTLGLQQDILNVGIAVDYDITDQIRAVLSCNTDIEGLDGFGTENAAQVTTYSMAIVFIL